MTTERPPVRLTTLALTLGSLGAAALLGLGLVLDVTGAADAGKLVGNIGVVVLLFTPAAGLIATWLELRALRPTHAWLAAAVLLVLGLATLLALLARP
jgi:hypothetical protein